MWPMRQYTMKKLNMYFQVALWNQTEMHYISISIHFKQEIDVRNNYKSGITIYNVKCTSIKPYVYPNVIKNYEFIQLVQWNKISTIWRYIQMDDICILQNVQSYELYG